MKNSELEVRPVSSPEGLFTITLFEQNGTCHVRMINSSLWRPQESQLILCEGEASLNNKVSSKWWQPTSCSVPAENLIMADNVWDTGKPWGSNYSAAMIAQNCCNDYLLVTSTQVTANISLEKTSI